MHQLVQDPPENANPAVENYRENYGKIFGYKANRGLKPPMPSVS